ncbi:MAG: hypothetical protein ING73_00985 [Rhodocyclaceae bacterium]|nr:hypothetical protein [Rhodocyclaceae bacterium]MCA3052527.1 hypothetical protein [Rhodocyclaceae bacterium]MCA3056301.1 hypothetical protein [Rhodocyclaceae bacterium]MCA3065489.1 hypothetical protein [Rhodocyclaceae bacterium]MCA3079792.1 hypothetical protein [Rhodocyclaceae bacterium]
MNETISSATHTNFFARCWGGKARLWQAFWICGVAGWFLVLAVLGALLWVLWRGPEDTVFANIISIGGLFGYLAFASVSVWRCAPNASLAPLGALARVVVVLSLFSFATAAFNAL